MTKKKGMTREDAAELYEDLRKALGQAKSAPTKGVPGKGKGGGSDVAKQIAAEISKAMSGDGGKGQAASRAMTSKRGVEMPDLSFDSTNIPAPRNRGAIAAVGFVVLFGAMRVGLAAFEAMGLVGVEVAQASLKPAVITQQPFSKEEVKVLTSLDSRRAELAERGKQLEERSRQLDQRDREFAVRVAQLKDLTDQLKTERAKNDKKRSAQIEQLANVYGSMSPQEASQLMEQLDVQIALSLIERMPEKKIGQILALMSKERALTLTKMLSGKAQG
jgi:flagellar motility protein MotE (MotC chaperone)